MTSKNTTLHDDFTTSSSIKPVFHTGDIQMSVLTSPPTGWILCDGSSFSTSTYPALYSAIGTRYNNAGDSAGTYRIPNLISYFMTGVTNNTSAFSDGSHTHTFTANVATSAQSQNTHTHTQSTTVNASSYYHYHNSQTSSAIGGTDNNPVNANKTGTGGTTGMSGAAHTHSIAGQANWGLVNSANTSHGHNAGQTHDAVSIAHTHTGLVTTTTVSATSDAGAHAANSLRVNFFIKY